MRVVCGLGVGIDSFCPSKAFIKVDLPALGKPSIAAYPDFVIILILRAILPEKSPLLSKH